MLPRLASFFNITIDQLMGYRPQLSREEIRQVYVDLAKEFTVLPFEKVLEQDGFLSYNLYLEILF